MSKLPRVTAERIYELQYCNRYTLKEIKVLMGRLKTVNAINILKNKKVLSGDKLWIIYQGMLIPVAMQIKAEEDFEGADFEDTPIDTNIAQRLLELLEANND